ncbi:ubiquitin-like protein [Trypanosoma cruzi]|nr:ubiquitin-like protein [Trypanosoma cruzi]
MEEGEANRSGTQGSTACTHGESGPSCLHPSRRVRTHTREEVQRTQQHKSKVTIKKGEIPAHHVDCWSTGSAADIHHKTVQLPFAFVDIQRTPLHAGPATTAAAAC